MEKIKGMKKNKKREKGKSRKRREERTALKKMNEKVQYVRTVCACHSRSGDSQEDQQRTS